MSKKQMGFTLIEIVMVLVLLGILSAVAVPKYFDLRDKAEEKAAAAIAAEVQARLNGGFANALLAGVTTQGEGGTSSTSYKCKDALKAGLKEARDTPITAPFSANLATSLADTVDGGTTHTATITIKGEKDYPFTIGIPQCNN